MCSDLHSLAVVDSGVKRGNLRRGDPFEQVVARGEPVDEAAGLCATRWSGAPTVSVYAGGVRFYRPIHIGHVVEVDAHLLHTGTQTMHISVHVRSGDPRTLEMAPTTHCLTVVAALDDNGAATAVRPWLPDTAEDTRLDAHARHLTTLRARLVGSTLFGQNLPAPP